MSDEVFADFHDARLERVVIGADGVELFFRSVCIPEEEKDRFVGARLRLNAVTDLSWKSDAPISFCREAVSDGHYLDVSGEVVDNFAAPLTGSTGIRGVYMVFADASELRMAFGSVHVELT